MTEPPDAAPRPRPDGRDPAHSTAAGVRARLVQSRIVVALLLVAAGAVWAIFRGLHFYGISPSHLAYDLDQPPWLLILVSGWLLYRRRHR